MYDYFMHILNRGNDRNEGYKYNGYSILTLQNYLLKHDNTKIHLPNLFAVIFTNILISSSKGNVFLKKIKFHGLKKSDSDQISAVVRVLFMQKTRFYI